jgi:hypothetical protein
MDLELVEQGDGGELIKKTNDLSVIYGFENMPFIAMFGGNVKESTPILRLATEQAFDWWGNNLLMPQDTSIQFNSETERALNNVPLTSAGRVLIQNAVENDLAFMKDFATVVVSVVILATDKVAIGLRIIQPDNLQKQDFIYIWNATRQELEDRENFTVTFSPFVPGRIFDFSFGIEFE